MNPTYIRDKTAILSCLSAENGTPVSEITEKTSLSKERISTILKVLREEEMVSDKVSYGKRGSQHRKWFITETGVQHLKTIRPD